MGFYISLSGIVTFRGRSADPIRAAAAEVPADKLLLETDAPFLAPVPLRGRRNEPAHIVHTARFVADLLGFDFESLAAQTTANSRRAFALTRLP